MAEFLKMLSVFLACAIVFGKIGMPSAMVVFEYNFLKVFLISTAGGIVGNTFFVFFTNAILKWIHNYRVKKHKIHSRKIFTRFNRGIIKVKSRFGLTGIALITPPLLSAPLGAFLAVRFFKNKAKILAYLSVSVMLWSIILYFLILWFRDSLNGWLI